MDCTRETGPCYSLELPGDLPKEQSRAGRVRLLLPEETFQMPPSDLEGTVIHVVSPLALYLLRETSALTRRKGERLASDSRIRDELRKAFLSGYKRDQLTPEVMIVEG
jgi:hypothetical protein